MREWLSRVLGGKALSATEAEAAFRYLVAGRASPPEQAAFLAALKVRGETPAEVAGGVRALRSEMIGVDLPQERLVDTCGTGGGTITTFNLSTAAALVAAGAGARVAKHGNRSFSSRCGSADVLEALGVEIELPPERAPEVLRETGFVFLFAPRFHPAMRHLADVRRLLGVQTIMNLLGPLASPARVRRQVVGVAEPGRLTLVAEALRALGHERALVVYGEPGVDELSPLGPTRALRLEAGAIVEETIEPEDFGWYGLDPSGLEGGEPHENAARVEAVIRGRLGGTARAAVALNAGAALWAAGVVDEIREGVVRAEEAMDRGKAWGVLEGLRALTPARAS